MVKLKAFIGKMLLGLTFYLGGISASATEARDENENFFNSLRKAGQEEAVGILLSAFRFTPYMPPSDEANWFVRKVSKQIWEILADKPIEAVAQRFREERLETLMLFLQAASNPPFLPSLSNALEEMQSRKIPSTTLPSALQDLKSLHTAEEKWGYLRRVEPSFYKSIPSDSYDPASKGEITIPGVGIVPTPFEECFDLLRIYQKIEAGVVELS